MVRCLDCRNLVRTYSPTTMQGALFDEKWKCKVTWRVFDEYYPIEMER